MFPQPRKGFAYNLKWMFVILFQLMIAKRITRRSKIRQFGNYYLYEPVINDNSIVYSFGIADDIRFETALHRVYGCKIYCYDPTPGSAQFMEQFKDDPLIKFTPKGVFHKKGVFKLYQSPKHDKMNSSLLKIYGKARIIEVECDTIPHFMRENGHKKIDVLKMDVEGVAVPVMRQLLRKNIRPKQIAVELEIFKVGTVRSMLWKFYKLIRECKKNGYKVFHFHATRKCTVELLFVRKDIMK